MRIRSRAQAAMNVFQCPIVTGERKNRYTGRPEKVRCEGTGFVPVTLRLLAKIRTLGSKKFDATKFTCVHYHDVTLDTYTSSW